MLWMCLERNVVSHIHFSKIMVWYPAIRSPLFLLFGVKNPTCFFLPITLHMVSSRFFQFTLSSFPPLPTELVQPPCTKNRRYIIVLLKKEEKGKRRMVEQWDWNASCTQWGCSVFYNNRKYKPFDPLHKSQNNTAAYTRQRGRFLTLTSHLKFTTKCQLHL